MARAKQEDRGLGDNCSECAACGDMGPTQRRGPTWREFVRAQERSVMDEETGDLPDGVPTPVVNLALVFGSIVASKSEISAQYPPPTI